MTKEEVLAKYERAVNTQKRRMILRSIMTGTILITAILNYFGIGFFNNARLLLFGFVFIFLIYSYAIGRRTGAAKDFKAIADYYMRKDGEIVALKNRNNE